MAVWFRTVERPPFDRPHITKKMAAINRMYGNLFRLQAYPRFSANMSNITRDLDLLEHTEGFVPKVIIVDYADILKPERDGLQGFHKEDETWMALARLAAEHHCLVVTASQVDKKGQSAKLLTSEHSALWTGKMAHVDAMMTINQTDYENNRGIARVGMRGHRHMPFSPSSTVTILQNVALGQILIDSELTPKDR